MNTPNEIQFLSTGRLIAFYRKIKNIDQEQLAFQLNIAQSKISDWENDKKSPTVDDLIKLSGALEVNPSMLLPNQTINFHNEFKDSSTNNGHINNGPNITHGSDVSEIKLLFSEILGVIKSVLSDSKKQ
jgi:transcriptional regulator with XRE-family HTH domain